MNERADPDIALMTEIASLYYMQGETQDRGTSGHVSHQGGAHAQAGADRGHR